MMIFTFFLYSILSILLFHHVYSLEGEGIIGGFEPKPDELKYMVAIYQNDSPVCGGGIIHRRFILTAAHCLIDQTDNFRKGHFKIVAGSSDLAKQDLSRIEINIQAIYVPSFYNGSLWQTAFPEGDIAVLKLRRAFGLFSMKRLQKLKLPFFAENNEPYINQIAVMSGYGFDNVETALVDGQISVTNSSTSLKLYKANSIVLDYVECSNHYETMYPSNLCGKVVNYNDDTPQGVCEGDSGGPLVYDGDVVIGVFSGSAPACNENNYPSVYTRVASFLRFIKNAKIGIRLHARVRVSRSGVF